MRCVSAGPLTQENKPQSANVRVKAGEAEPSQTAPEWRGLPSGPSDPLVACISRALSLRGRDMAGPALTAGLPLPPDGRLTPELAVIAVEASGGHARLVRRRLEDIDAAVLPVVLFLAGRDACVLEGWGPDGAARLSWPARATDPLELPRAELAKVYSGGALLLKPPAEAPDAPGVAQTGHWFWGNLRGVWGDYGQVVLASALINTLALATPIFTMNVYDRVFPNASLITLWSLVAGVGIALTFDAILKWLRATVIDAVGRRVDLRISSTLFRHIADLQMRANLMPAGTVMNSLKDFEQVRDFFGSQTVATVTDLCFAVLFIGVIYYLGGPLALPPAIAFVTVLVLGLIVLIPLRRASAEARARGGAKNAVAVEAITDLETLKAIGGAGRMQARWERQVAESAAANEVSRRWANLATTVSGLAQQAASIGIVIIGVYLSLDGQITMGAVIAAMILSGRALAPTAALTGLFVRGSFAIDAMRGLEQIMALPTDRGGGAQRLNAEITRGALKLEGATLQYPGATQPSLANVSLDVPAGTRIGVIGAVGSGKTSLVRLLSGLYAPDEGAVLLDGLNMAQVEPAVVRRAVQLVPQDPVLFSGTLAENIAFGAPQATDAEILGAARAAGVDAIAAGSEEGFGMRIAERGRNLSGGQRQMVALARALVARPRVLVLDEPTSSMDQQSERRFIARLGAVLENSQVTLVVATHRMGLLDLVDRLVLLDQGRKMADGPKAEVIAGLEARSKAPAARATVARRTVHGKPPVEKPQVENPAVEQPQAEGAPAKAPPEEAGP